MRTERNREVSAKRLEREANILHMFAENKNKELTVEDAYDLYSKTWPDDKGMDPNLISVMMKSMYDSDILCRERRTVKKNRSGRIESVSIFFYKAGKNFITVYKEAKKLSDENPDMNFIPNELQDRITFKNHEPATVEKKKDDEAEKNKEKVEKMGETITEFFSKLTFVEALDKLYHGYRVVSAVSGYIYAIMDGEKKGLTSSANPGVVIAYPSAAEMEGVWRIVDKPKTCPYCNSKVKLVEEDNGKRMYYMCTNGNCCARGPYASTPEEAVNKFNTRISE